PQPIREEYLLTGPLESTNEPYAIAKIAGLKLAQAYNREYGRRYVTIMPTNLYGPGDNFDLENGHVLAALLAKIDSAHRAGRDTVEIWGSGTPRREFLYVDDLADACVLLMGKTTTDEMFNVGTGQDLPILELAQRIAETVGYTGSFVLDRSRPDGTPVKRLDVSRLARLGWRATTTLEEGLARTYDWYCQCRARP
ncbi:MAG: NAD-dependent epimerase/dehydratase family protein, partial [Gammaproteobacteria bacterium]|nr:NAD-dependent epimerase/dehydratase family protein [Gammaproteobacteria bacterium]